MITFEEAKRLSILKWKWLSRQDEVIIDGRLYRTIPELRYVKHACGFCELYWDDSVNRKSTCGKCPLNLCGSLYKNSACLHENHPFNKYQEAETPEDIKKYARKVLNLIKKAKESI